MGFSADWLALRDPADRAARDVALLRRAAEAAGPEPLVVDLGCGTGATWRALAPLLPAGARWRFVENDPALLERAGTAAAGRPDLYEADILNFAALPLENATLVTASALLDLVSETWVEELALRLGVPFYAALSYDGRMSWTPNDPRDKVVTSAFNKHQRRDKGFGPALGPEAGERAAAILARAGFEVHRADSMWRLGPAKSALQRRLTDGIAEAAAETGAAEALGWGRDRHEAATHTTCLVGHMDILAQPGSSATEAGHADR